VVFAIDRAGIVGADGPTHTGAYDISFLRCIPNMVIMTPANEADCRGLLTTAFLHDGPSAVRYPRGSSTGMDLPEAQSRQLNALPFGQAEQTRQGSRVALLAFGTLLNTAMAVAEEINASVYNMRFVKPLDVNTVRQAAENHDLVVTIEDNAIAGGAGSAVAEFLNSQNIKTSLLQLGFPDEFINHGEPEQLYADWNLDKKGMLKTIQHRIKSDIAP
jgi:1-deoxy-D-xylulose-5-phosphate synthase